MILSAGDNTGVNFCRSLRMAGSYEILSTDTKPYRLMFAVGDKRALLPDPTISEEAYLAALQAAVSSFAPRLLYAADTNSEQALLFKHRSLFEEILFLPSHEATVVYEDKWQTYNRAKLAGLPVPETILVRNRNDVDRAIGQWGKIWLRSIHGSGGRNAIVTDDRELAWAWINRSNGWGRFTAAEVLTSRMATWIGLWWNGKLIVGQGRERLHWEYGSLSPTGVTGITGAQKTINDSVLARVAIKLIRSMGFRPHGIVSVDFTYDQSNQPRMTEIQGSRFYSSIFFLAKAGLNFPDLYCRLAIDGSLPIFETRIDPLPPDLLWLKSVDSAPKLTTIGKLSKKRVQWDRYSLGVE